MTTSASVLPDGGFLSQPWQGRTARLASRRLRSSLAVISARGDIDASNADTLTEYTLGHLMGCRGLILDLRGLDFFGTEGFSALHRVSVCCARARIAWAVVPGEAVCLVLRIGDPQGLLPAAGTVEAAMTTFRRPARPSTTARREPQQPGPILDITNAHDEQLMLTEAIDTLDGHAGSALMDA